MATYGVGDRNLSAAYVTTLCRCVDYPAGSAARYGCEGVPSLVRTLGKRATSRIDRRKYRVCTSEIRVLADKDRIVRVPLNRQLNDVALRGAAYSGCERTFEFYSRTFGSIQRVAIIIGEDVGTAGCNASDKTRANSGDASIGAAPPGPACIVDLRAAVILNGK